MHNAAAGSPVGKHIDEGPVGQIFVDHHGWELHHPDTLECSKAHLDHVIRHEAWLMRHQGRRAVRTFETPLMLMMGRAKIKTRQGAEVGGNQRTRQTSEQLGTCHQLLCARRQHLHDQIAFFERREAHANAPNRSLRQ